MFKKLTAFVMALCVIGGTALYAPEKPLNIITASAEEEYTEVTEGSLTFHVYADHAEVYGSFFPEGEIIIPAEINGVPVTSIGERAFDFCRDLTSINIPENITSIGMYAFEGCAGLTSINIPESVTSIGESAFWGCTGLTSINIPAGVTSIGRDAFEGCTGLTSINIPDGVTSIGEVAFRGCTGLTSINIPDSVKSIGEGAFDSCSGLTSINIPDGVTNIEDGTFYNCTGLTSINIPDGVTNIGASAFYNCTELTSINIPDGVTNIGNSAFENCSSLISIIIPKSVTIIGYSAFNNCTNLTEITILAELCAIYSSKDDSFNGTIYGYYFSSARVYAEEHGYKFVAIGDEAPDAYLAGDANLDGKTSISDAVRILQYVSNKEKYNLSGQALENADVYNKGDGITGMDAASIQKYDSGVIDSLPESVMEK